MKKIDETPMRKVLSHRGMPRKLSGNWRFHLTAEKKNKQMKPTRLK
ncbi:MAG: hypothetical protein JJU28_16185 [Cyclobacteriaceae bacterium]|nr:hypothetical protein [Cyclobacteriaceae bacterium]